MSPRSSANFGNNKTVQAAPRMFGASTPQSDFEPYSSDTSSTPLTSAATATVVAKSAAAGSSGPQRIVPWALVAGAVSIVSCVPQIQFPGWQWTVGVVTTALWCVFVIAQARKSVHEAVSWSWSAMGLVLSGLAALAVSWWSCLTWASDPSYRQAWDWAFGGPSGGWLMWPVAATSVMCAVAVTSHTQVHWTRFSQHLQNIATPGTTAQVDLHGVLAVASRERLAIGAVCIVQQGQPIPADCVIIKGNGHVNDGFLPALNRRSPVGLGDWLPAGAVNVGRPLTVRVVAEPTRGRMKPLRDALEYWWQTPQRCDSELWVRCLQQSLICMIAGGLTAGAWLFFRPESSLTALVAVMAAAIPGVWWLAQRLQSRGLQSWLMLRGALLLRPSAVERLATCRGVVIDDSTRGWVKSAQVTHVYPATGWENDQVLAVAAQVAVGDARPWCQAVVAASDQRPVSDEAATAGRGSTEQGAAGVGNLCGLVPTGVSGKVGSWFVEVAPVESRRSETIDVSTKVDLSGLLPKQHDGSTARSSHDSGENTVALRVTADGYEIGQISVVVKLDRGQADLLDNMTRSGLDTRVITESPNPQILPTVDRDVCTTVAGSDWAEFMTSRQLTHKTHGWFSSSTDNTLPSIAGASVFAGEAFHMSPKDVDLHLMQTQPDIAGAINQARKVRRSAQLRAGGLLTLSAAFAIAGGAGFMPPVLVALGCTAAFMVTVRSASWKSVLPEE